MKTIDPLDLEKEWGLLPQTSRAVAEFVNRKLEKHINDTLFDAVKTINEVQNLIGTYTGGSGTMADKIRLAWNKNAYFLADHSELQKRYLDIIYKRMEQGGKK